MCTVVGGVDCTESASAAGDDYPTGQILGVEALATFLAGLFGGITQTTPYIGHPALVFACVPALAFLAYLYADQLLGGFGIQSLNGTNTLRPDIQQALDGLAANTIGNEDLTRQLQTVESAFRIRPDLASDLHTVHYR